MQRTAVLVAALLVVAACSDSNGEELEALQAEVAELEDQLEESATELEDVEADLREMTSEANAARVQSNQLREQLFDATSTTTTTTPPTTVPTVPVEVLRADGANDTQTADFTVVGDWSLTADVSGGAGARVAIMSATTDGQLDYISFDPGGGQVSQFRTGGTFYLDIATFGASYSFVVVDLPG